MMVLLRVVVVFFMIHTTLAAVFSPTEEAKISSFMKDVLMCGPVPSLTVGVVKNNEVWTRGFGKADLELGVDVDAATTLFGIGSLTKAFTATLLAMQLDESQGRYSWDSKLTDLLGMDFRFIDEERTKHTTLKDLLTHRTGLNSALISLYTGSFNKLTRSQFVSRIRFLPSSSAFRDKYAYNNWMYALVGYVVEVLSGESWEVILQKKILDPLGMTSTKVIGYTLNLTSDTMAQPYTIVQNQIKKMDLKLININPVEPVGAIFTTADDMVKWTRFLLNGGKTASGRLLLNKTSLAAMFEPHQILPLEQVKSSMNRPVFPEVFLKFGYGYAWTVGNYKGYRSTYHGGVLNGYTSRVTMFRDLQTGVFISQTGPTLHDLVTFYLTDLLLGHRPWLNASTVCSFPSPWAPPRGAIDNSYDVTNQRVTHLDRYVGQYGHRFAGDANVKRGKEDGSLVMQFGAFTATMNTTANERFFKMEAAGVMFAISHRDNDTLLFPALFKDLRNGRFMELEMQHPDPITFRRDISFYDPFPADSKTSVCISEGITHVAEMLMVMMVTVLVYVM